MKKMSTSPFSHIHTQFLDTASFLWGIYESALTAPHYNADKIRELRERLDAQLDGLRSGEEDGWVAVLECIFEKPMAGELFVAAVLAIESNDGSRLDAVLQVITKPVHAFELTSALTWFSFDKTKALCDRLLASVSQLHQLAGLAAYAVFRQNPAQHLEAALNSPDTLLRCCALKMIGELNLPAKMSIAKAHFSDKDPACAFRAAWSAALLGDKTAIPILVHFVDKKFPFADEAAMVALRRAGLSGGTAIINDFAKSTDHIRWAIIGTGALGDVSRIPWLIEIMKEAKFSRVAGESFSMITGLDIAKLHMDTDAPEDFEETPNDDPKDEEVDLDADHFLPWPDVEKVGVWWKERVGEFTTGTRYLCGKLIDEENLQVVLESGYQRQRLAASVEILVFRPGEPFSDESTRS